MTRKPKAGPVPSSAVRSVDVTAISAGAACIVFVLTAFIFFSHRDADVGRLPQLLAAMFASIGSGTTASGKIILADIAGVLIASLIVASWFGLGSFVRHQISARFGSEAASGPGEWTVSCAIGSGIWSIVWFVFGMTHQLRLASALLVTLVGLLLCAHALKGLGARANNTSAPRAVAETHNLNLLAKVTFALIAFALSLTFVAALAPPTGKDELIYHLALPVQYVKAGAIVDVPGNIPGYYTHGVEMLGAWALLIGEPLGQRVSAVAFGVTLFAFLPLLIVAVYSWSLELGASRAWALAAAGLLAATPVAFYVGSNGYVDMALCFYLLCTFRMAVRWWRTLDLSHLMMLALLLGAALATKLTGVFAFFPLVVVFLARAQQAQKSESGPDAHVKPLRGKANGLLLACAGALLVAVIVASPWYLRTWARTGNPVFPFYTNILRGTAAGWDDQRSQLLQVFLKSYGGATKSLGDYLLTPLSIVTIAQPDQSRYYDGVIGVWPLVGMVLIGLVLFLLKPLDELKVVVGSALCLFLLWVFSSQQLRFLLPVLALVAVALALSGTLVSTHGNPSRAASALSWLMVAALCVGLLVQVAWFAELNPVPVVLGSETQDQFLRRRLDYYPYYELINADLPATSMVWLVNMRRDSYHIERPIFSDYAFEDYTLVRYVNEAQDIGQLRARIRGDGITHLLARHDVLLDYKQSPVVDEMRTETENRAKLALLETLLLKDSAHILRSDSRFSLVKLTE